MKYFKILLCSFLLVVGTLSCQIGLGEAVDTVAPTIKIQNPPLDSIVRDDFLISGEYEDDGSIEYCSITMESTDGTNLKYELEADVDQEKKIWSKSVDVKANKIFDGPYQITVEMKDKGGHKTIQTRQFTVDNTPPVVVLQRPATKIKEGITPDSYGQLFTLSGQAADDSNISSITVNVFSDPEKTKLIHSIELNNVPPTIDLDAAKFEEGIENDYSKIYGSSLKEGTKEFYCSIIAYDSAQRYPVDGSAQTPEDKKGNAIDYYYLYEDISSLILGDYKITEIYKMLSGKYSANSSRSLEDIVSEITKLLAENRITGGSFSLNPANNPSFTVSGYNPLKKDGSDFSSTANQLSNKTNVVIEVSAGLDGIPLKADTLKVFVTPCDKFGNAIEGAERYYPIESEKKQSGSSYKFVTKILNSNNEDGKVFEVGVGKYYLLGVEGEDQKGNKVIASGTGYGLEILPSGGPKLDTKLFVNNTQVTGNTIYISDKQNDENSKLTITGSVIVEDGAADVFVDIGGNRFDITDFESTDTYGERRFTKTVTTADFPEPGISKDNITFEIIATNGVETKQEKTIVYDCKNPVIELQSLSPIAYKYVGEAGDNDGKEYLNGENISVKFRISDDESGVDATKPSELRIYQPGKERKIPVSELNDTLINTTVFDEGAVTFEVIAFDKAGNKTVFTKEFVIDQNTDIPVILPDDSAYRTLSYDSADEVETGDKNLYEREDTIRLKFIDDDGLGEVGTYKVYGRDANGNFTVEQEVSQDFNFVGSALSTTKDLGKLPKVSGTYKVEVSIKDKFDKPASKSFFVRITPPEPTVTIKIDNPVVTTNNENVLNPKSSIKATMNVDSEYKKYNIYRWFDENEAEKTKIWDGTTGVNGTCTSGNNVVRQNETTYTDTITPDGIYKKVTYKFVGLDEGNNEAKYGTNYVNFSYDMDRPIVESLVTPTLGTFTNDQLEFTGKSNDSDTSIYLGFASYSSSADLLDPEKFVKAEGTTVWNAKVTKADFSTFVSEGNKTVYVYAVDSIGNISAPKTATFNYDIAEPKIINTGITGVNKVDGVDYLKKDGTLTISGKAYDTNELTTIEVQDIVGTEIKFKEEVTLTNPGNAKDETSATSWTYNFAANDLLNGNHTIKVIATDVIGRKSEVTKSVFVDRAVPVVGDITVPTVTETESTEFTFNGKVTDEGGSLLSEVYLGFENDKSKCTIKVDGTNVWNKKIASSAFTSEGEKTVYVWAKDIAGNESVLKSQTFKFDKSKPEITSLKVNDTEHKDNESFFIGDLFKFNVKATDTWGVKSVSITESVNDSAPVSVGDVSEQNGIWISPELPTSNYRENGKPKTGTYKYEIKVTDNAGKVISKIISVSIDVTAPTITLESPSMDSEISGKNSISGGSFTFRGTVTDVGVSGIDYYEYAFTNSDASPSEWTKVSLGGVQNWTIYRDLVDGTNSVSGKLNEGSHYLHIKAADKAGNVCSSIKKSFWVDKADPVVNVTVDGKTDYSKTETNIVIDEGKGKVSFTVSDTHGLASPAYKVIVKKDGQQLTSGDNGYKVELKDGVYNVTITGTADADGLFEYSIIGVDKVGKETESRVVIRRDTQGPVIKTTSPTFDENGISAWITSPNVNIIGVCEDVSGIDSVYYSFESTMPASLADWIKLDGTSSWTIPVEGKADGDITLHIAAVDTNGKETKTTKTIKKDSAAPALTEKTLGTGIINVSASSHPNGITISGTSSDSTSGLEKITITDSLNQNNPWVLSNLTGNSWSKTIELGDANGKLKDGDHTLTIVAKDNAGNSTTVTRNLKVDTQTPSISGFTVVTTPNYKTNWFKQNSVAIKLTGVSDANKHDYASGILAVEYSTDNTTWISMTKGSTQGDYTATVNCTKQGANTISVRVKDSVGNEGTANNQTVYIDTETPNTPEDWSVDGVEEFSGSKLVNKRNDVVVLINASDKNAGTASGIQSVSYGTKTVTTPTDGKYKLTIPKDSIVNGKCTIKILDNVGNELTWIPFSFEVDDIAPEVTINAVSDADKEKEGVQVNKTITISGSAKDGKTLKQVDICRYDGSSWTNIHSRTEDLYSFEIEEDTTKLTDTKNYVYAVIVTDEAGNKNLDTTSNGTVTDNTKLKDGKLIPSITPDKINAKNKLELNVLQDSDRPVIKFTNMSFTNMSSSTRVGHQNKDITGTISDDDGIPTSLKVKGITNSGEYEEENVEYNATDGSFTISLDDGVYDLSFEVVDIKGTLFNTDSSELGGKPKCIDKDSNKYGYDTDKEPKVYVKVDTRAPDVGTPEWSYTNDANWDAGIGAKRFGGTKGEFYIRHIAKDDNGISSVIMNIKKDDGTFEEVEFIKKGVISNGQQAGYEEWISPEIDVSSWHENAEKSHEATITVSDGIKETISYLNITVDNKGPVVNVTSPTNLIELKGSMQFSGSIDSAGTIKYAVTKDGVTPAAAEYKEIKRDNSAITWAINFDGDTTKNDGTTHDFVLADYLVELGIATELELQNGDYDDVTSLDLHFEAEDDIGNKTTRKFDISVDPQGDRPSVGIDYPAENGSSVGGQIRLSGSVSDTLGKTIGVNAVYVQLTSSKQGSFTAPTGEAAPTVTIKNTDLDLYKSNGYTVKNIRTGEEWNGSGTATDYGIEATVSNGTTWGLVINAKGEFNDSASTVNNVGIKVFAKDNDGKISKPAVSWTKFDSDAPDISQLRLENSSNTIVNYTDDVCVKGSFTLKGNVKDQAGEDQDGEDQAGGIKKFTIDGNDVDLTDDGDFEYELNTASGVGVCEITLYAEDFTDPPASTQRVLRIKYDNVAPVLVGADSEGYKIDPNVRQSNGYYELRSQVKEDIVGEVSQSGLDFVSFYFVRRISTESKAYIYDPMTKESNNTEITSGLTYESGMYWENATYSAYSGFTITVSDASNAKVGGLLKVGGQIYKISSVEGNVVTLKTELPAGLAATGNVLFAKALVVDNTSAESPNGTVKDDNGYPTLTNNDDGDGFVEGIGQTATTYEWYANIVSKNIPDGPIEIHYVAFDKAGNYSIGIVGNKTESKYIALTGNLKTSDVEDYSSKKSDDSVNVLYVDGADSVMNGTPSEIRDANYKVAAFVRNNAPRLAGVRVWTDYNGNGNEDESESSIFYYAAKNVVIGDVAQRRAGDVTSKLVVSGNEKDEANGGTAFKIIKGTTKFYPNIVGGNGALYYKEKIGNNTWVNKDKDENGYDYSFANGQEQPDLDDYWQTEGYAQGNDSNAIEATLQGLANSSNVSPTWFEYEIHDTTEGTTRFDDSLYASMSIALNIQCNDTTSPNVDVERFFWKGPGDNSLYKNSRDNGHIELDAISEVAGLPEYYDDDPKVSGQITVRGVAYDNIRLKSLSFVFEGIVDTAQEFATYSNGSWTVENGHESTAALSNSLKWTASVKDLFIDEKGHQVAWEINIDTNSIVGLNKQIKVSAMDLRGDDGVSGSNISGTPGEYNKATIVLGYNRPTYQVDVVPYITNVTTRLSGKVKQNKSIYSRSAKGKYSIDGSDVGSETVKFAGFNLDSNNSSTKISETGDYQYMNGTIPAINNYNNNDASGNVDPSKAELKDKYNMQGNGITNDTLTDDISFLVWDINKQAATAKNGKIYEPVMHINPTNELIGFAFANGSDLFSMPNGDSNSYTIWQKNYANYTNINFVYGSDGRAHSLSTGLDTNPDSHIGGRLHYINSIWGGNGQNMNNWNNTYSVALDNIGVPDGTWLKGEQTTSDIIDIDRFSSASIAVAGNERVYIAYFDRFNNQIRFVYGTSNGTNESKDVTGLLKDRIASDIYQRVENGYGSQTLHGSYDIIDNRFVGGTYKSHTIYESSSSSYSVVAGVEYPDAGNTASPTGNTAGEYLDIAVIPGTAQDNDVVVFVWYDGTNLNYTFRYGAKDDTDAKAAGVDNKWGETKQIFTDGIGEHCAVTVDANGGIHIAAYSRSGADLYYAYIAKTGTTQTPTSWAAPKTCLVDSYSQVGTNLAIDVAFKDKEKDNDPDKVVPYISYYADGFNGLPKVAYFEDGISSATDVVDGVDFDTDMFKGNWEVALVPTESITRNDNVNVGVWKTAGERKTPTIPENAKSSSGDTGTCYGNGKSYFVLGYATEEGGVNGYIETAQLK